MLVKELLRGPIKFYERDFWDIFWYTNGRRARKNTGGSTGTVARQTPDTVMLKSLENNGRKCLWRGCPAQPTAHLMPPPHPPPPGSYKGFLRGTFTFYERNFF